MRSYILSLGVFALSFVAANEYPDCEKDNCYNNFIDSRFSVEAPKFCFEFLSGVTTAPSAIPTHFKNCEQNIKAVSSACSCITYTATHTSSIPSQTSISTTTPQPVTTSSAKTSITPVSSKPFFNTTITSRASSQPTVVPTPFFPNTTVTCSSCQMTTSTVFSTTTFTITQCPETITNCPVGSVTTTVVPISTTTFPVMSPSDVVPVPNNQTSGAPSVPNDVPAAVPTSPTTEDDNGSTPTGSTPVQVTNAANRASFEVGFAAIGVFAALLLLDNI